MLKLIEYLTGNLCISLGCSVFSCLLTGILFYRLLLHIPRGQLRASSCSHHTDFLCSQHIVLTIFYLKYIVSLFFFFFSGLNSDLIEIITYVTSQRFTTLLNFWFLNECVKIDNTGVRYGHWANVLQEKHSCGQYLQGRLVR